MNEQLRKAIEEATKVEAWIEGETQPYQVVPASSHFTSQAKLLRVIELLVQQRNREAFSDIVDMEQKIAFLDAELIAALEGK